MNLGTPEEIIELISNYQSTIAELEPLASVGLVHMPGQTFHTLACAVNNGGKCDCGGLK